MTDALTDDFLAAPRYGILTTLRRDGSPVSLPVWIEWDGVTLRMFCHQDSAKLKRLRSDPRASVIVVNHPDETENWVSFDGTITVRESGGLALAERLFDRYYPQDDPRRDVLERWRAIESEWRLLEMKPSAIRVHEE
jgi:PPOX class probable F420-dependent enzyme